MIKIERRTPNWVYEFGSLVGGIDDGPLPEHVLNAKALTGHVAHVKEYVEPEFFYRDHSLGPVGFTIHRPHILVNVQYPDMCEHTFEPVLDLHVYMKRLDNEMCRFFIAFRAMHEPYKRDPELEWFVGKPLNLTKEVLPSW